MDGPVHYHCPGGCEKPQPFKLEGTGYYCGRCWHEGRGLVEVFLCTEETCD
jgi:hypothetical protein